MCKMIVFGGTSEGRILAQYCSEIKLHIYVSVTTKYGSELLTDSEYLHKLVGKMDENEIANFLLIHRIKLVIDATHPYAKDATHNITNACKSASIKYMRIVRDANNKLENALYFDTLADIISYLNENEGGFFLTTGSKNLAEFCNVKNFRERCAVRVLPAEGIIEKCELLGFDKSQIIAEKGPFTTDRNLFHLTKFNVKFLVTKDSGAVGGFAEKVTAAEKFGAKLLILKRPVESGVTLETAKKILLESCHE